MSTVLDVDSALYLLGDEDAGVGLHCRPCDTGGRPVVYYTSGSSPYPVDEVPVAATLTEFLRLADDHLGEHLPPRTAAA